MVKGTKDGTQTNSDGQCSIDKENGQDLIFSSMINYRLEDCSGFRSSGRYRI
jgi:hypothetical protein